MEKPKLKHNTEKAYDYSEVIDFIEYKYKIQVRDYHKYYKGDMSVADCPKPCGEPYLDFWHWLTELEDEIRSGAIVNFGIKEIYEDEDTPKWVKEILKMIMDEFEINEKYGDINFYFYW